MTEYGDIRTGRYCIFVLHDHLVFVTKFRHRVFTGGHLERMKQIMRDVCADHAATTVLTSATRKIHYFKTRGSRRSPSRGRAYALSGG
ncbi:transposase [Streptosporangium sp. CA-115845]|uniref:transposase n=1 Tax=Streptosporangium sp. CA-115845 TaxID=3240071 RepID=UPI003D912BF0